MKKRPRDTSRQNDRQAILAAIRLSRLPGVGAKTFRALMQKSATSSSAPGRDECVGGPRLMDDVDPVAALKDYESRLASRLPLLATFSQRKAATEEGIDAAENFLKDGGKVPFWGNPGYPAALLDIPEPPPVLFIRGRIPLEKGLAIVGTRHPDSFAEEMTGLLVKRIEPEDWYVVSGGASGVDSLAHEGAMKKGVATVGVLGCGIDVVYPPANKDLFQRIQNCGGLVSELLPGTAPRRGFFPTRNRIIAGLSEIVIMIQGAARSGSLITARMARALGRLLLVVTPPNSSPEWAGNHVLLGEGATPLTCPEDLDIWLKKE